MTESGERESTITALQSLRADPIRLAAMAEEATTVARKKY